MIFFPFGHFTSPFRRSSTINAFFLLSDLNGTRASPERYFSVACSLLDDFGVFSESLGTPELGGESKQQPLSDAGDEKVVPSSIVSISTSH